MGYSELQERHFNTLGKVCPLVGEKFDILTDRDDIFNLEQINACYPSELFMSTMIMGRWMDVHLTGTGQKLMRDVTESTVVIS